MISKIITSLFLLQTVYAGYTYKHPGYFHGRGGLTPCCPKSKWRPIPGLSKHVPSFTTAYAQPAGSYGAPTPVYGPPKHGFEFGGNLNDFGSNFGGVSNHLEGLSPPGLSNSYGVPSESYGPPSPVYGVPFQSYGVPLKSQGFSSPNLAHHKVLAVQAQEAQLPSEFLNPFYKNPGIKEALAKHSWFGPGEKHVSNRETDRISRQQIWEVLNNAGLLKNRR